MKVELSKDEAKLILAAIDCYEWDRGLDKDEWKLWDALQEKLRAVLTEGD